MYVTQRRLVIAVGTILAAVLGAVGVSVLLAGAAEAGGGAPDETTILRDGAPVDLTTLPVAEGAVDDDLLNDLVSLDRAVLVLGEEERAILAAPGRGVHAGSVCMVELFAGGGFSNGCNSAQAWARGKPIVKQERAKDGSVRLIGLVPDATARIELDGEAVAARARNFVDVSGARVGEVLRGTDASGRELFSVKVGD